LFIHISVALFLPRLYRWSTRDESWFGCSEQSIRVPEGSLWKLHKLYLLWIVTGSKKKGAHGSIPYTSLVVNADKEDCSG